MTRDEWYEARSSARYRLRHVALVGKRDLIGDKIRCAQLVLRYRKATGSKLSHAQAWRFKGIE